MALKGSGPFLHTGRDPTLYGGRSTLATGAGQASYLLFCGAARNSGGFGFSSGRHGGGRQGSAVGAVSRLHSLSRCERAGAIAQNIGGIANLTAISAGGALDNIIAFDTGPGNMVMDGLAGKLFGKSFDRDGGLAASGTVQVEVVERFLRREFFQKQPPKTAGREEFGREFAKAFLQACKKVNKADVMATATAFTARSIRDAIERFVLPGGDYAELIVSGGGAKNPTLMAMLANEIRELGLQLRSSDEFGIPSEAKEAVAFAVLAFETWNRRPSNVPAATGGEAGSGAGEGFVSVKQWLVSSG